jgi:hypothetical protein
MHVAGSLELRVKFGKSRLSLLSLYNRAACRRPTLVSVAIVELCCVRWVPLRRTKRGSDVRRSSGTWNMGGIRCTVSAERTV